MNLISKCIAICIAVAITQIANAKVTDEHIKVWTSYDLTGPITKDKKFKFNVQPNLRFVDDRYKFEEAVLHISAGYQASKKISLWLGNTGKATKDFDGDVTEEYRIWEQLIWDDLVTSKTTKIKSRTRLEQRKEIDTAHWAVRLREKLTWNYKTKCMKYSLIVSDELFFNLNHPDWVSQNRLSQNRAFFGIGKDIDKKSSFEIGYMNQYQFSGTNQNNHILYLGLITKAFD